MSNALKTLSMTPHTKPDIFAMPAASLSAKVTQWLADHPEEFLSAQDVVVKFGAPRNSVAAGLRGAVAAGVLTARTNPKDTRTPPERVYQIGTADWRIEADQTPAVTTWRNAANEPTSHSPLHQVQSKLVKNVGCTVAHPTEAELQALRAETGVPLIGRSKAKADQPKWAPVFELLTQPGHSVAFPASWKTGVTAYGVKLNRKLGKRTYHVRSISKEQARVWRIA